MILIIACKINARLIAGVRALVSVAVKQFIAGDIFCPVKERKIIG